MDIEGLDKLRRLGSELSRLEYSMPTKLGNVAVNFYRDSFRRQGFIKTSAVEKWKEKKQSWDRKRSRGKGSLLVKTGRMRRAIRITGKGRAWVMIGNDTPYAKAHNEGATINQVITITPKMRRFFWAMFYESGDVRWKYMALKRDPIRRTVNIPQRQFMGLSDFLNRRLEKTMEYEIKLLFDQIL